MREAQDKESRLFALLDGLATLWKDTALTELLQTEGLNERPELVGSWAFMPGISLSQVHGGTDKRAPLVEPVAQRCSRISLPNRPACRDART